MISWLKGEIVHIWQISTKKGVVLNVGGVGYEIQLLPKNICRAEDLKKNMQSVEGDDSLTELQKTSSIIEPVFIQGLKQVINEITSGKLKLK